MSMEVIRSGSGSIRDPRPVVHLDGGDLPLPTQALYFSALLGVGHFFSFAKNF